MKLTFKLVFAIIALVVLILGTDTYLSVQRESAFLERELEGKAYRIGKAMKELVADAWRRQGPDIALALIQKANQKERSVEIRWVWLDAGPEDRFGPKASAERLNTVTRSETVTVRYRSPEGDPILLTYVAVNVGNRPGALELTEPLSVVDDFVRTSIYRKVVLVAAVLIATLSVTLLLGIWLVGWPLRQLSEKAKRVGSGDLSGPIEVQGRDELSELATTLNQMCDRLESAQQQTRQETEARLDAIEMLRHTDRLRTVGQLASGIAHELGTPLNVVTGRASLISSGRLDSAAIVESAGIIKSQADRMANIIRKLLDFSRSGTTHFADADLLQIVRETVQILEPLSRKHEVELIVLDTASGTPTTCYVDAGQIQQVLTNLVVNAIQATPSGGRVTIGVTHGHDRPPASEAVMEGEYFCLTVEDTGQGIAEDVRARLFEPFVTTKDVGQGTGLGLSIAYGIVREHGGWIGVESEIGRGSRFQVFLPERKPECQVES